MQTLDRVTDDGCGGWTESWTIVKPIDDRQNHESRMTLKMMVRATNGKGGCHYYQVGEGPT